MQLGKEYTNIYDSNKDGSVNEDEFIQKEMSDYKKMFQDEPMDEKTQLAIEASLEQTHKSLNTDDKDGIGSEEMTAYLALIDAQDSQDGSLDGQISYSNHSAVGSQLGKLGETLKVFRETLFPNKKPEQES
jgi:hypothetical protein